MIEPELETLSSDDDDVRAGMQGNIRLLIYHSAFIFLTPITASSMKQKVMVRNIRTRAKIDQVDATLFAEQRLKNIVIKVQQYLLN